MSKTKEIKKQLPIPTQDRVLVSKKIPERKTAGGIIIPETVIQKEYGGFVIGVGPTVGKTTSMSTATNIKLANGTFREPYPIIGDHVLFGEYSGTPFTHNGEDYLLLKEADILAILP